MDLEIHLKIVAQKYYRSKELFNDLLSLKIE